MIIMEQMHVTQASRQERFAMQSNLVSIWQLLSCSMSNYSGVHLFLSFNCYFSKGQKNVFQQLVVNHFLKHLLATSEIQNAMKCFKDVYTNCAPSAIFCNFFDFQKICKPSNIDLFNRILTRVANICIFNTLLKACALEIAF